MPLYGGLNKFYYQINSELAQFFQLVTDESNSIKTFTDNKINKSVYKLDVIFVEYTCVVFLGQRCQLE